MPMNNMLKTIAKQKKAEVSQSKQIQPKFELSQITQSPTRDFVAALKHSTPAVIAEIKKGSPSKGIIREKFDVAEIAKDYSKHGAACLSVLTDETFFFGHQDNIQIAKLNSHCPILRKDFIIDPYQIYQSRALGADCILLIVAMLTDKTLLQFCQLAQSLSMDVLVESHSEQELERALMLPTPLIGINNRDLNTFKTDLQTTIRLKAMIPDDRIVISESGIHTENDIQQLRHANIHSFLIGESLMRQPQPGKFLQQLCR